MKRGTLIALAILSIGLLFSFKTIYDLKQSTAEVEKTDAGYYMFMYSTPAMKYTEMGHTWVAPQRLGKIKELTEKQIIKTYPKCDGYIILNKSGTLDLIAIQFDK